MKLELLDFKSIIRKQKMKEITDAGIMKAPNSFVDGGLFSERIFGIRDSLEWRNTYAYIDLHDADIIHPAVVRIIKRLDSKLLSMLHCEESYDITYDSRSKSNVLSKSSAATLFGGTDVRKLLNDNFKFREDTSDRKQRIDFIYNNLKYIFVNKVIVLPPSYRPVMLDDTGNVKTIDDMNNIYIKILNNANKLKRTKKGTDLHKFITGKLQILYEELYEYCKDKVSKKSGLVRKYLLGKRVDYSARAVIAVDPKLKLNTCGMPIRIGVLVFEPFLLHYIFFQAPIDVKERFREFVIPKYGSAVTPDAVKKFFIAISKGYVKDKTILNYLIGILQPVVNSKHVLLKRDPNLHKGSIQAFTPILYIGDTVNLHPMVCGPFNADFDGDQMAVFSLLSEESQAEAKDLMTDITSSTNYQKNMYNLANEMIAGVYVLTKEDKNNNTNHGFIDYKTPLDELESNTYNIYDTCKTTKEPGKVHTTTIGRLIYNKHLPSSYPFVNETLSKKSCNAILADLEIKYDMNTAHEIFDKQKDMGFKYATLYPKGLMINEFNVGRHLKDLKSQYAKAPTFEEKQKILNEMIAKMKVVVADEAPMMYDFMNSGARGGWSQLQQMIAVKGIVQNANGDLISINGNFTEGLSPQEYFYAGDPARKGMIDRALNTADTGYLSRKLVYACASVMLDMNRRDCGTKKTIMFRLEKQFKNLVLGRYIMDDNKMVNLSTSNVNNYVDKIIHLRTPIYCKTPQLCRTCYGDLSKQVHTPYVGVIAAQAMGEKGSQTIMRTFHTGGATEIKAVDLIKNFATLNPSLSMKQLKEVFKQDGMSLTAIKDIEIRINMNNFEKNEIEFVNDKILCIILDCDIYVNNVKAFELFDDQKIIIQLSDLQQRYIIEENMLKIPIYKGSKAISFESGTTDMSDTLKVWLSLIEKKTKVHNPQVLYTKLANSYGGFGIDLVHVDILVSQLLRNKAKPEIPARLVEPYSAKVVGIKQIPFIESWSSGLMFENSGKSIETGLLSSKVVHNPLEDLITGNI